MKVLAFGELLWDVIDGKEHIGGAPFNCAAHLARMGADSALVSALGEDERGTMALREVRRLGIRTDFLCMRAGMPTGIVDVHLDGQGKPSYEIREGSAWDRIQLNEEQMTAINRESWDIAVFGTLAQRTDENIRVLQQLIKAAEPAEVFFDVNLRLDYFSKKIIEDSLNMTTILKLNDEEVSVLSGVLFGGGLTELDFCKKVEEKWHIHTTVLTRGGDGSSVYQSGRFIHIPAVEVSVIDTVGAGDSFSAAFLYGYFQTGDVERGARFASLVSSFVASKSGAVPLYDERTLNALKKIIRR